MSTKIDNTAFSYFVDDEQIDKLIVREYLNADNLDMRAVKSFHRHGRRRTIHRASLYNASNYLVHLYDKFENKYSSNPTKIQKLLFIAELTSLYVYRRPAFEPFTYDNSSCGFKIPIINSYVRTYISDGIEKDDKITDAIEIQKIRTHTESNIPFFSERLINKQVLFLLQNVFINFATYSPESLGIMLDDLKDDDEPKKTSIRSFEMLRYLNNIDFTINNKIANFISNYTVDYPFKDENNE